MTRPVLQTFAPGILAHGGGCCGMRHLRNFSPNLDANADEIVRALDEQVHFGRLAEVTLNSGQMQNYPNVMAKLAQLGFVLVGHFYNQNSGNRVGIFHLATTRLPLEDLNQYWHGQVITPTMGGELQELRQMGRTVLPVAGVPLPPFSEGAVCRIESPRSRYRGEDFTIVEMGVSPHSGQDRSRFVDEDRGDHTFWVLNNNLFEVTPAPPAAGAAPRYLVETLGETVVRHPTQ